jgi:hypothetical protein
MIHGVIPEGLAFLSGATLSWNNLQIDSLLYYISYQERSYIHSAKSGRRAAPLYSVAGTLSRRMRLSSTGKEPFFSVWGLGYHTHGSLVMLVEDM